MKYYFPDYYKTFRCIGAQCPDTCCAGWQISIDSQSLAKYKKLLQTTNDPAFAQQLRQAIHFRDRTFRLKNRRCSLLNHDNLCDLYIHAGPDSLCKTCRSYPRHLEEFGNLREITLSLSCPEAARIILSQPERPVYLTRQNSKRCPSDQEVDEHRLQWLLDARNCLLDILWQPYPLPLTAAMLLAFAHDLQRRYQSEDFSDLQGLAKRYLAPDSQQAFSLQLQKRLQTDTSGGFSPEQWSHALFFRYRQLEPIVPQWPQLWNQCRKQPINLLQTPDLPARQLISYYIQVYLPGAVYDDDLWGKAVFAVLSWIMTNQLSHVLPADSNSDSFTKASYLYSRQVENHDPNLEALLDTAQMPEFHLLPLLQFLTQ